MSHFRPLLLTVLAFFLQAGSIQAEEVRLKHEGLALNGNLALAEGKSLTDGVVLITHGTLAHNKMELIAGLQDLLQDGGVNTLAINLSLSVSDRHGSYDCTVPHQHRHEDAVGEIDAWIAWLAGKDAGPVTVLGHSRGGSQTALYAATKGKGKIARVVLLAPATVSDERTAKSYRKSNGSELWDVLARAEGMLDAGKGEDLMRDTGILYCSKAAVSARSFVSYYGKGVERDTPTILPKIGQPVLVVAGSEDNVVPDIPQRLAGIADGNRLRLEVIDGADHFFRDLYLEDAAELILEFLQ